MPRLNIHYDDVRKLPRTHSMTIPEEYLDEMGHMNVMWYTHLFSQGMGGLFELFGLSWDAIREIGGGTFALESHVRFLSEVRVGQTIEIYSRLVGRSEKRFHAVHFMTNQDKGDVSAVHEMVGAYVDLSVRRMAPIPSQIASNMDKIIAENQMLAWPAPLCGVIAP